MNCWMLMLKRLVKLLTNFLLENKRLRLLPIISEFLTLTFGRRILLICINCMYMYRITTEIRLMDINVVLVYAVSNLKEKTVFGSMGNLMMLH